MAITLKGVSSPTQRGNEAAETGINLDGFSVTYKPEWKDKLPDYKGQSIGFGFPNVPSRMIKITGEVTGTTGLMAAVFGTALTLANDVATFDSAAGGIYMDEVTEIQGRLAWRRIDMSLSSDPLIS